MLDFGSKNGDVGVPVLFVPSLINRGTILDLREDGSMMRGLAHGGIRPMLLEWGWPGPTERGFDIGAYITHRLEPAIAAASRHVGDRIGLAGYCMGGLLCVAAAQRRPELISALALIATPWDFHLPDRTLSERVASLGGQFESEITRTATLPIDAIQLAFAGIDPEAVARKFRKFGTLDQQSDQARLFVAIEDWANDAVPLAGPVALECLQGWYADNRPARGEWMVDGCRIQPERLDVPSLFAIPQRDRIVPQQSANALAETMMRGRHTPHILRIDGGHVGLVAGSHARELLWDRLRDWLLENAAIPRPAKPRRRARRTPPS